MGKLGDQVIIYSVLHWAQDDHRPRVMNYSQEKTHTHTHTHTYTHTHTLLYRHFLTFRIKMEKPKCALLYVPFFNENASDSQFTRDWIRSLNTYEIKVRMPSKARYRQTGVKGTTRTGSDK